MACCYEITVLVAGQKVGDVAHLINSYFASHNSRVDELLEAKNELMSYKQQVFDLSLKLQELSYNYQALKKEKEALESEIEVKLFSRGLRHILV